MLATTMQGTPRVRAATAFNHAAGAAAVRLPTGYGFARWGVGFASFAWEQEDAHQEDAGREDADQERFAIWHPELRFAECELFEALEDARDAAVGASLKKDSWSYFSARRLGRSPKHLPRCARALFIARVGVDGAVEFFSLGQGAGDAWGTDLTRATRMHNMAACEHFARTSGATDAFAFILDTPLPRSR